MSTHYLRLWIILLFLLAMETHGYSQSVNFEDGFEDGDFSANPTWTGDDSLYTITEESENHLLQLDGNNGDVPAYLSVPSTAVNGSWEFYVQLDFAPSDGNRADVFLMSDSADLNGSVNGYALRAGESGSNDVFRIVRYDGGSEAETILSGTTDISSGGGFRVKVTRAAGGLWSMEVAEGYDGVLAEEGGTATDNTYASTSYFGVRSTYTSTRSDKFFYDDFTSIEFPVALSSLNAESNQELEVLFTKDLEPSSVSATDFSINNGVGSPYDISAQNNTVTLFFTDPLPGDDYVLTVSNLDDQSGNTIDPNSTLSFSLFDPFELGDIIINEFMYDPPTGQPEYVEIKNRSDKILNLQDWHIGDDTNTALLSADTLALPPNEFLVLSSDTTTLSTVFGDQRYTESYLPALNNTGDAIRLITDTAEMADSLTYASDWGGNGVALERRSGSTPGTYRANWGDSPADLGGTPGIPNQVAADESPPLLTELTILSNEVLKLGFDERLDSTTASAATNYQLSNSTISSATVTAPDSVELTLTDPLQNAQSYTLTISDVEDIFANAITHADTTFTHYEISSADSGDIAINEFMYDPPPGQSEYVELYNRSDKSFDLRGWTLSDNRGNPGVITSTSFILPPDSFIVLAPDDQLQMDDPDIALITMNNFPALNNGSDHIVIHDNDSTLLDSLAYKSDWGGTKVSLERRSVHFSGTYQSNWGDAPDNYGTPGAANAIEPDTRPPTLADFSIQNSDRLFLQFSEELDKAAAEEAASYVLGDGPAVAHANFSAPDSIFLTLNQHLQNATQYTLTIENITDIFGNTTSPVDTSFTFYQVSPVDSGDVFINEFMYDPPSGSAEFVELYNPTARSFDLHGWTINDNTGNRQPITNSSFIVPPDSFVVIAEEHPETDNSEIAVLSMGSRFPTLNNNEDQIVLRDSSGVLLDSLQYSNSWSGSETSLERQTTSIRGTVKENWGDAPDSLGSPGYRNRRGPDTDPPELEALHIRDSQRLLLLFSERLKAGPATTPASYSLSGGPAISTIDFLAPDSVLIGVDSKLPNATELSLSIQNISDIFGNSISLYDTTFTHYAISEADSGDIFINEFNYNPASGETEYIEIYNPTNRSFDLSSWTLSDNRGMETSIAAEELLLPPESYAVLAPDNTLLEIHPDINLAVMGSSFPALNNSGDDIVLKNSDGTVLDSLQYSSGWGGNEQALERKTTEVAGTFKENWGPAPNKSGSPGAANSIPEDEEPPELMELYPVDESKLQLVFSESVTASSATDFSNYQFTPGRNIQLISVQADSVTLFLSDPLVSGESYEVSVSDIADIFGNTSTATSREIEYLRINGARNGDIVINEIMPVPGNGEAEFVELYNRSDKNIDLTNWTFGDASGEVTFGQNLQLRAHQYLTLTGSSSLAQIQENTIRVSGFPNLNNAGDLLFIRDSAGATIDSLHYRASWGTNIEGRSLERKDPYAASNDPANWQSANSDEGFSAGVQNSRFEEDTSPPQVTFAKIRADQRIEVQFNEFIRLTEDLQLMMDGQPLSVSAFDSTNGNRIILQKTEQSGSTVAAANIADIRGNIASASEAPVARPLEPGDLVINEIMFNPLNDADDNQPDQSEYVELYNTRDYALSLEGVVLHDAPDENGEVRELHPVSTSAQWVQSGETVLIYADQAPTFGASTVARFFDLEPAAMQEILQVDRTSLSLASDDAVYLADSTGAAIDSVYYSETWHNPNLVDTRGIALERITPEGPSSESSSWGSSVHAKGGTPKAQNSIYQDEPQTPRETGISFTPNPFSPDDDGYEDNLVISYKLDHSDYLLRINIFDRYGRHIKELADGKPAGFEGSLIWDGRRDDGRRNRIGIYIIVFEAYDSASGSDKAFKKPVVIARKLN